MTPTAEPFVGDELISITMHPYAVELNFKRDRIEIGGAFVLCRPEYADEQFHPEKQLGNVQALWPLIGRSVTSTWWGPDWGDTVELVFNSVATIRILPVRSGFRGAIHGKFPPPGTLQIQDF